MTIESTNDNTPTTPAITYSECYVQPFKDKEFDLAIVDPSYGIGAGSVNFQNGKRPNKFYKVNDWDNAIPLEVY